MEHSNNVNRRHCWNTFFQNEKWDHDDDDHHHHHVDAVRLVTQLRSPPGLLFIPQMICEHGEPWWNNIDRGKLLILAPELSGNSASRGGTGEESGEFCLTKYLFNTSKCSLTCRIILRNGADVFTSPLKEGVFRNFIALKNISPSALFEPANIGSNGKYANHQTTEDD
jgi:hypothetical protein